MPEASTATRRIATIGCVLGLEYLALSLAYDAAGLLDRSGALRALGGIGVAAGAAVVVVAISAVAFGSRYRVAWASAVAHSARERWDLRWLGVHALAFAGLGVLSHALFAPHAQMTHTLPAGILWLLCLVISVISLLLAVLTLRALRLFCADVASLLGGGALFGLVAWGAGLLTLELWGSLSTVTLYAVATVLQYIVPTLVFDPVMADVGDASFYVRVAPFCSGYEGIGLIVVFIGVYAWTARETLRFPRAWLLFPIAIVAVFVGNVLRIVALIEVGLWISPDVAVDGFHSKAGWVFFCAIGLGLVAWSRRSPWFSRAVPLTSTDNPVSPFVVPLLSVIAAALLTGLFTSGLDRAYGLRVLVGALALFAYRRRFPVATWMFSLEATGIGALVFAIWLALAGEPDPAAVASMHVALDALGPIERSAWIVLKLIGSLAIIPIVEERAFRGYLLRRLVAADFVSVPWQRVTWLSVSVSSLAFGALHQQWIAGSIAGALFGILQARRGNFGEAVFAHAVSNTLIALWVLGFGRVDLWA